MSDEAKLEPSIPEEPSPEPSEAREPSRGEGPEKGELLPPSLLSALRKVVPVLWLMGAALAGLTTGPPLVFLVLAAGALTLVVTLMWSSVQSLTGGAALGFEEALGMGAPSRVEEEKRAVLRALKDLEYERSVGKISPEDYAELSARYRTEAKRLMQRLDEALGPARAEVERAIEARLARAGIAAPHDLPAPSAENARQASPEPVSAAGAPRVSELPKEAP